MAQPSWTCARDRMREAYNIAKLVEIKLLIDTGLEGAKLGERLHQTRARAFKESED